MPHTLRFWLWLKLLFQHTRHIELWRLAWAAAMVLGLVGLELLQSLESHTQATTLTLLFRPGLGEAEIRKFLQTLPEAQSSLLREPTQLLEDAQRLLKKRGHAFEAESREAEAFAESAADIGWAAQLHWRGLPSELTKQLAGHIEAAAEVEEAFWTPPPSQPPLAGLLQSLFALFALALGAALLVLSLGCLHAEAKYLRVLLELGATPAQVRGLWWVQGFLWAVFSGAVAYALWKFFAPALSPMQLSALPSSFIALGTAYAGAALFLAWHLRGQAWCT